MLKTGLSKLIDYAMNPSKTTADKIFNDGMKNGEVVFVRGINCIPEFAKAHRPAPRAASPHCRTQSPRPLQPVWETIPCHDSGGCKLPGKPGNIKPDHGQKRQ